MTVFADAPQAASTEPPHLRLSRLQIFTVLWGAQALIHQDFFQAWTDGRPPTGWLVTLLAILAIVRPRLESLLALSTVSLIYNVQRWPDVPNHILVEGVFNFTIAAAIVWSLLEMRRRDDPTDASPTDRIFERFAPVLIFSTVTMYWFAALAKLNHGFLDTVASCGVDLYGDLRGRFPFLPSGEWTGSPIIIGTIVVELAIPLFLGFRRTRMIGLLIGMPFHVMLGLIGYRTFSAFAFAVYFVFVADQAADGINRLWPRVRPLVTGRRGTIAAASFAVMTVGYFLLSAQGWDDDGVGPFELLHLGWLAWLAYSFVVMGLYGYGLLTSRPPTVDRRRLAAPGLLWLIAALVVLNGSAQYLGIKTETSFTMYSNLSTESGTWNHLFIPELTEISSSTEDTVRIESTDLPELLELTGDGFDLTWFEFRRVVTNADDPFAVTYVRDGVRTELEVTDPGALGEYGIEPLNPLEERLLFFRPIPQAEAIPCQH